MTRLAALLVAAFAAAVVFGSVSADEAAADTIKTEGAAAPAAYKLLLIREDCWDVITGLQFGSPKLVECVLASVKKTLGYGIIAGSTVVKVPQIWKIVMAGSSQGVSLFASYMDLVSNILTSVWHVWYGSSFDKYGESIIVGVGAAAVIASIWYFKFPGAVHAGVVAVAIAALLQLVFTTPDAVASSLAVHLPPTLASHLTGGRVLDLLITISGGVFSIGRLLQISEIIRLKTVGELSPITAFMNFAGTAARVFTSSDLADPVQYAICITSAALNAVILVLFVVFPNKKGGKTGEKGAEGAAGRDAGKAAGAAKAEAAKPTEGKKDL